MEARDYDKQLTADIEFMHRVLRGDIDFTTHSTAALLSEYEAWAVIEPGLGRMPNAEEHRTISNFLTHIEDTINARKAHG